MSAAPWRPNKGRASEESLPVTCTPVKGTTDSVLLTPPHTHFGIQVGGKTNAKQTTCLFEHTWGRDGRALITLI